MTNEERDLITQFIGRVGGNPQASGFAAPAGAAASNLPPVDRDADALLADLFQKYPEARYRITQLAFVQEHALTAAQNRINELQAALNQARGQAQATQPSPWGQAASAPPQPSRGLFGSLFGGGSSPRPPQPQYAPPQYAQPGGGYGQGPQGYAPQAPAGMFQRQGSGFLGGALQTAAGVAGGVVAGNALMNMFSGGHGGGLFGGGGLGEHASDSSSLGESAAGSAWGGGGADPYDSGGALKDQTVADNSGWSQPDQGGGGGWTDATSDTGGGWTDTASDSGGGWTDTSGGNDDYT